MRLHRVLVVHGLVLALVLSQGCSPGQGSTPKPGADTMESSSGAGGTSVESTPSSSAPTPSSPSSLDDVSIRLERVARGLREPVFATHAADGSGRIFVLEQAGRIRVVREGRLQPRAYLDIANRVSSGGERGLLGLAFSPDFERSGRFYIDYTDRAGDTIIERYVVDDPSSDTPRITSRSVMLKVDQPYANHNGGCIAFAPDGTLWVGMGDGGSAGDPENRAQDRSELLGKMLSLDVENAPKKPEPKVIHYGLRNPWRFSFDEVEQELWIGDVGQNAWEEIDVVGWSERDLNFGWDRWEGDHPYPPGAKRSREGFTFPVIEYSSRKGHSVTGGYVYRGRDYPQLQGVYFYGDFVRGWIAGAKRGDDGTVRSRDLLRDSGVAPSSFGVDESGELYVCDYNGSLLRIVAK